MWSICSIDSINNARIQKKIIKNISANRYFHVLNGHQILRVKPVTAILYHGKAENAIQWLLEVMWTTPIKHDKLICYVYANTCIGMKIKKLKKQTYLGTTNVQLPQPHLENVPVPVSVSFRQNPELSSIVTDITEASSAYSLYEPDMDLSQQTSFSSRSRNIDPILISQKKIDFLAANLTLSQRRSEYMCAFLKKKHLLEKGVNVTAFRHRQKQLQ